LKLQFQYIGWSAKP